MCNNKEEKKLATNVLCEDYTLNQSDANKILATPRKVLKPSNIFNDIKLNDIERIEHAVKILHAWRNASN